MTDLDHRLVLDHFPDGVLVTDASGRITYVNRAAERLLGWSKGEIVGRALTALIPGGLDLTQQAHQPEHPSVPVRRLALCCNGRELPIELTLSTLSRSDDALAVLSFRPLREDTAAQVTEQTEARERLRDIEPQALVIADAVPQIVWTADDEGPGEFYNRRWYEYTGLSPDAAPAEALRRVIHPDDLDVTMARWRRSIASREPYEVEIRLLRASDHTYRWHLVRAVPLGGASGRVSKWVGSATDIEDQKRAQENTRFFAEASALLSASLDYEPTLRSLARLAVPRLADWCSIHLAEPGSPHPKQLVVAHSDPAKVRSAEELNRRYPADLRTPRGVAHVIRSGASELYPTVTDEMMVAAAKDAEHLRILREAGMRSVMIVPLRTRSRAVGAMVFVSTESGRRYDEADLLVAQELADRAGAAVDNARLYEEAQQAIRVRDDFLSIASHELKTPLTPLALQIQAMQQSAAREGYTISPQRLAGKLETIARQVGRLERLVDGLLDISRITSRNLHLDYEDVDLCQVVREVAGRSAEQAKCPVNLDLPEPVVGRWDRLRLDQIVSSLLDNAIKFGAKRPIDVSVRGEGDKARLTVLDHGIGVAPEDQGRIFERFERAVATKHYGGFGLGLWITRQIVEALGGSIHVESELGAGALFTVELPLSRRDHGGDRRSSQGG